MFGISYNPAVVKSIFSYAYSSKKELVNKKAKINELLSIQYLSYPNNYCVPVLPKKHINDFFYVIFNEEIGKWIFYHSNKSWTSYNKISKISNLLDTDPYLKKYLPDMMHCFGYIVDNSLQFIYFSKKNDTSISPCTMRCIPITSHYCYIDLKNNFLKTKVSHGYKETYIESCSDLIVPLDKGMAHINSSSFIDLIFIIFKLSANNNDVDDFLEILTSKNYYDEINPAFQNFFDKLNLIRTTPPMDNYNLVYQLFSDHDKNYFDEKMTEFRENVLETFNKSTFQNSSPDEISLSTKRQVMPEASIPRITLSENRQVMPEASIPSITNFLSEFIGGFKRDISFELNTVYHRLRCFPQERIYLYEKFSSHPYIRLIKLIHQHFVCEKNKNDKYKITTENIYNFLTLNDKTNLVIYDNRFITLMDAVSRRNELFVEWYKLYLNSIVGGVQPKYKPSYYYFPFKLFYCRLFIMEHVMNHLVQ